MMSDPIKLPMMQIKIDKCIVLATPRVIIFAIQCWNPQNINKGMPKIIPSGVPFLYIYTAIYIIIPQRTDLIKNGKDTSQVFTFATALLKTSVSVIENNSPIRYPANKFTNNMMIRSFTLILS